MALTKADIVERLYKDGQFSKKEAQDLVEKLFEIMKKTLIQGDRIKIIGFGNFLVRDKSSRKGRNPQTGESMEIKARRVVTFRPSQLLKEDITERYEHRLSADGKEDSSLPAKVGQHRALDSFKEGVDHGDDDDDQFDNDHENEG